MRRSTATLLLGSALLFFSARSTEAQIILSGPTTVYQTAGTTYKPPGYHGTSWGVASYGSKRTYSAFSSPYGAGYSYGYAPYGILPGKYGTGLWRQTTVTSGQVYGAPGTYSTYTKPFRAVNAVPGPPIGVYAPAFGPGGMPPMIIGN